MPRIDLPGSEIHYEPAFIAADEAERLFSLLFARCAWQRRQAQAFGRSFPVPRDEAYYGDAGTRYSYSRRIYDPLPWLPELLEIRGRVEMATCQRFNAVLCNLYRNGSDSVAPHRDNEPELAPAVASISLGTARVFRFLPVRKNATGKAMYSRPAFPILLAPGSLLFWTGITEENWGHELPKDKSSAPRINLTFRRVGSTEHSALGTQPPDGMG